MQTTDKLMEYIQDSPSPYHAAAAAAARLEAAGFTRLEESAPWALSPGQCCYTTRNQSSLIAFRLPGGTPEGWRMTAAHSDSPTFYVKNDALEGDKRYVRLAVEGYGGMNCASWLDRPLTVAGRAVVRTPAGVEGRLVYLDRDLLTIPSLAIHQQRDVNRGHDYNAQKDMQPLYALGGGPSLTALLAEELGVDAGDILATDLVLCPRQAPVRIGPEGEFFQAPRIDDLGCAYATLEGFLSAKGTERFGQLYCLFDNEEVGSGTRQGAMSSFLPDVLTRIGEALGLSAADHRALLADSMMLSCDNGHARHPNHPELADTNEAPVPNGGVVVKHSPRYATDGVSAAVFTELCRRAEVPVQHYANRPDQMGGATLGNIADTKLPIPTVDIGMAQLAMHSCFETMGSRDVEAFVRAVRACYESSLRFTPEGVALR